MHAVTFPRTVSLWGWPSALMRCLPSKTTSQFEGRTAPLQDGFRPWSLRCSVCPPGGATANNAPSLTYSQHASATLTVSSVSPALGAEGTRVTVQGTLLVTEQGGSAPSVYIGGKACNVLSANATLGTIACAAPGHAAGTYKIEVHNDEYGSSGLTNEAKLMFSYPLCSRKRHTKVVVLYSGDSGLKFVAADFRPVRQLLSVHVGGKPCEDVAPADHGTIRCLTPPHSLQWSWRAWSLEVPLFKPPA